MQLYFESGQIHEAYGNFTQAQELYFGTLVGLKKLATTSTQLQPFPDLYKEQCIDLKYVYTKGVYVTKPL